jgi:pimeloyl-ACP methyl ester carboxylesterase
MNIEPAFDRIGHAHPERAIVFLHGILGRGHNLRTIAKRFVDAQPQWAAYLVDLRGHGRSPKGTPDPSLEAAARDVVSLAARIGEPLAAIAGHSFGGKVALEAARIGGLGALRDVIVIDSAPGAREPFTGGDSALALIETIESLPATFRSRREFIDAMIAAGKPREIAEWLSQSLEYEGDHARFALSLNEIRALILDYFARDLWSVVENPPVTLRVHLIIGDRSGSYSNTDRDRAARLSAQSERVTFHVLPAGHWVHVDNPDGLLETLVKATR